MDDYTVKYTKVKVEDYNYLREKSKIGAKKSEKNAQKALDNSIFIVSIYHREKIIGMGRIVGDGAVSLVITDVMVDLDYQRQGVGSLIMKEIDNYLNSNYDEDAYIILLANTPYNKFYEKFGFVEFENKRGMLRK